MIELPESSAITRLCDPVDISGHRNNTAIRVAVVGAADCVEGELLRLLIAHPEVEEVGAVSSRFPGKRVDGVHPHPRSGFVPVVSPSAIDERDHPVDVDTDRVAAALAVALGADQLVLLTGAPGVLADPDDDTSLLSTYEVPATGTPGRSSAAGWRSNASPHVKHWPAERRRYA